MTKMKILYAAFLTLALTACAAPSPQNMQQPLNALQDAKEADFDKDRAAILAMAGNYQVTFDFRETVALADGYALKDPKISKGHEIVRVLEDTGTFISLQHVLVAGGPKPFAIKHWRQDWVYEPTSVFAYAGDNTWHSRAVPSSNRQGQWAQLVYQVDDSPRYAGVGAWDHTYGVSSWDSHSSWRPLPRRDSTTRDDYDVVVAVNRHVITPTGWVHEQDNAKLALNSMDTKGDREQFLAREVGVNTYVKFDDFRVDVGEAYIEKTEPLWAEVREAWRALETQEGGFSLTLRGEPEDLYGAILETADLMMKGEISQDEAVRQVNDTIARYTTNARVELAEQRDR